MKLSRNFLIQAYLSIKFWSLAWSLEKETGDHMFLNSDWKKAKMEGENYFISNDKETTDFSNSNYFIIVYLCEIFLAQRVLFCQFTRISWGFLMSLLCGEDKVHRQTHKHTHNLY